MAVDGEQQKKLLLYSKILFYLSNHKPDICSLFCDEQYSRVVSELMYTCMTSIRDYLKVHKKHSAYIDDQVAQHVLKEIWEQIPFNDKPMNYYLNKFYHHLSQKIPIVVIDFIKLLVKSDKSKYDQALKEFCYLHCMSVENFEQFINSIKSKKHEDLEQYSDKLNLSKAYLLSLPCIHQEYVEKVTIRGFLKYHQNLPITYAFLQSVWDMIPNKDPLEYRKTFLAKLQQSQEVPSMIMKFIKTINSNVNDSDVYNQTLNEFCYLHCMSNDEFDRFFQACDYKRKHNDDEKSSEYSETLKNTIKYYSSTERTLCELHDIKVLVVREFRNYHHFVNKPFQHIRSDIHRQQFFKDGLIKLREIEPFFNLMFNSGQTNTEITTSYLEILSLQCKVKQVIDGVETEKTIYPVNDTKELRTTFLRSAFLVGIIQVMYNIAMLDEARSMIKYEDVKDLNYRQLSEVREFYKEIHEYLESLISYTDRFISFQQPYDIPMDQLHCDDAKKHFNEALILTTRFLNTYCESGTWKVLAFWRHKTYIKKILKKTDVGYDILRNAEKKFIEKYKVDLINEVNDLKKVGDILIIPFRNYSHMAYACIEKYNANDYKVFIFNGGLHYELFTGEDSEIRSTPDGKRYVKACIRITKDPKLILTPILDALFKSKETIDNIFQIVGKEIMKLPPFYFNNEHEESIEFQEYGNCPLFNLFITIRKVKPDCYDLLKDAILLGARPYLESQDLLNLQKFKGVTDSWVVFKVFSIIKTMQHIGHHC